MRTYRKDFVRLPDYAMAPLVNGDLFGMNQEDKDNINKFMQAYNDMAKRLNNGDVVIAPLGEESYFSGHPAFGKPCCVYDCCIKVLYNKRRGIYHQTSLELEASQ